MELGFLRDFVIIFGVAIAITFVFHRFRIAPIVGYLIAGVLLGPSMIGIINDAGLIEVLAEVGVVLLLFLIGVEFSLKELIRIRRAVFLGGFIQVFLTTLIVLLITIFFGFSIEKGIFVGFLVAMSSTAIVLKVLSDRGEIESPQGSLSTAVLIFQDLSVVFIVLLLPMLGGKSGVSALDMGLNIFKAFAIVGIVLLVARFVVPILLYRIVKLRNREVFLIGIVLICLGTAWLTSLVGLSLALGAFIAGLVISESEYGYQAFSEILPIKDIFVILFFVSIGMLLDVNSVINNPAPVILAVVAILLIKIISGTLVPVVLGYPLRIGLLVGVALFQIGEFSFVLSKEGINLGLISTSEYQVFLASAIITMVFTPFMIQGGGRFSEFIDRLPIPDRIKSGHIQNDEFKKKELKNHVIIIGFGLNGRNISRVLSASSISFIVIEINPETVRIEKQKGLPIMYGDASKESVLEHASITSAHSVMVVISDASATRRVVELARRLNPSVRIIVRTRYIGEVGPLYSLGAKEVIPEEFETSIEMITRVLRGYFIPANEIEKHISGIRKDGYEMFRSMEQKSISLPEFKYQLPGIEIETIRIEEKWPMLGKKLAEIGFRTKYGVTVLAIQRGSEIITNPSGETQLIAQDIIVVIGARESISGLSSLFYQAAQ